ncbi:uncharacterized protein [Dermacentor andersoni]|uniref:uncharacterized protein n=1 Tax=Dermacentor andersoni TaxID=34620 RepID=UPI002416CF2A|nr:uncharacterized protein LOC129383407 [Dermacentor andersoni]
MWLIAMGLCTATLLLIGISVAVLVFQKNFEGTPSKPEEVDFPELGGSSDSSPPDPVPIRMPPATSRIPAPVVTKTPRAVPAMGSTPPTMRPTAPTAPPAEPSTVPTVRPAAPTKRPAARTKRPAAPTKRPTAPTETPDTTTDTPYTTTEGPLDTTTETPDTPPIPEEGKSNSPR